MNGRPGSGSTSVAPRPWSDADWPALTFWGALERAVEKFGPEHPIFRFEAEGEVWTLRRLREEVVAFGRALIAAGVGHGDAVAVWSPGRSLWPLVELGAAAVGATVCGLNTRYRRDELDPLLATLRPRLVFVAPDFLDIDSLALVEGALGGIEGEIVVCPREPGSAVTGKLSFEDFLAGGKAVPPAELSARTAAVDPGDAAIIQFTSGSTGHPKGVVVSHDAALRAMFHLGRAVDFDPGDLMYSAMPFYHIGGSLCTILTAVVDGVEMLVAERFDPAGVLDSIERERCNAYQGQPTMYAMVVNEQARRPRDLSSLHKGWGVAPPALMRRIRDELGMTEVVPLYGLSECGLVSAGCPGDPVAERLESAGRPVPATRVVLRDPESGEEVTERGGVGEIVVSGPLVMNGYLDEPEATAAVLRDGWLSTGDLGRFDADGFLHFVGRLKDMIKPGGENVSIAEVERFLLEDERIVQVAVVGIPDERLGEVPAAIIEPATGQEVTGEEVIARCRAGIANFKVPRPVLVAEQVPVLATGKVDRREVRRRLLEAVGQVDQAR